MKAVDGVSFRVRKGTTFGIVGESGSGKTTYQGHHGASGRLGRFHQAEGNELVGIGGSAQVCAPSTRSSFRPVLLAQPAYARGQIVQDPLNLMDLGSHEERESGEKEVFDRNRAASGATGAVPAPVFGGQRQRISIGRALRVIPN